MATGGGAAGGFPSLATHPLDQIRDFSGELGSGEPRTKSHRPPPLFIAHCDRGPPAIVGLGAPDQGADQRPNWAIGSSLGLEINLTISPLISYQLSISYHLLLFILLQISA